MMMLKEVITKDELFQQLKDLGVVEGQVLLVHSSLSSFGYVVGGAQTVVDVLLDLVGYEGTIVMPLFNRYNSEPSLWDTPQIPHQLQSKVRENTPPFSAKDSDALGMGVIVDNFRRRDGVLHSWHPAYSFACWGKYAKLICNRQSLHFPFSEESPLARIYELKGSVLLLGVDYSYCSALHLAEHRSDIKPIVLNGGAIQTNQGVIWKKYLDISCDSSCFNEIGELLETRNLVSYLKIGLASCRLFKLKDIVDCGVSYYIDDDFLR